MIAEFWNVFDSSTNIKIAYVAGANKKEKFEKAVDDFKAFPTYFPIFMENHI